MHLDKCHITNDITGKITAANVYLNVQPHVNCVTTIVYCVSCFMFVQVTWLVKRLKHIFILVSKFLVLFSSES